MSDQVSCPLLTDNMDVVYCAGEYNRVTCATSPLPSPLDKTFPRSTYKRGFNLLKIYQKIVCFITTRKILGFYICVVNSSRVNVLKERVRHVSPQFCVYLVCMWVVCMWNVIMIQGHRYFEPPILGVQRRCRVKCQHPNSHPPHSSNSVKNCTLSPTTSSQ